MLSVNKVLSVEEAVALVRPRDTIATSGFVGNGTPDALIDALARSFEESGTPRDLTLVFAAGQGDGNPGASTGWRFLASSGARWGATGV